MLAALVAASAVAAAKPDPHRFVRTVTARHQVALTLVAAYDGSNGGFNFDGYASGELFLSVPIGWRVVVRCENRGPLRHSCAVVRGAGSGTPAFRGAETPQPFLGLQAGTSASFSFRASRRGTYRLACLVPGHEDARMWDVLDVGKTRRVVVTTRVGP